MLSLKGRLTTLILILFLSLFVPHSYSQEPIGPNSEIGGYPELLQINIPLTGAWRPGDNPLLLAPGDYADLTNMRYTNTGIEGVSGYSKINTSVVDATYLKIRNGFHFVKDEPAESHVLVQAYNTGLTASRVYENTTAIPNTGNFSATVLHTDAPGASKGRFATAPQGAMVYCNEADRPQVWGGDEGKCMSFITSTAAIGNSITNPRDYTDRIQNTLQTSDEVASIGGGTAFSLLMHCDSADGGTTFTDTVGTHSPSRQGNAQTDTAQLKFGTASGLFDGAGDYITISDHDDWNMGTGNFTIDSWVRFEDFDAIIDSYTKLLLHGDGDDASTTITDDSCSGHTVTAEDDAQLDTAQKKWTSSILFDGTDDYLSVADHADWYMGSGNATIDFQVRFNSLLEGEIDAYTTLLLHGEGADGSDDFLDSSGREVPQAPGSQYCEIDTAQKKFGSSSILFKEGYPYYVAYDEHDSWTMGSEKFTIDQWVRLSDVSNNLGIFYCSATAGKGAWFRWDQSEGKLLFIIYDSPTETTIVDGSWSPSVDTWYHIALIRGWGGSANGWAITVDGTVVGTATSSAVWEVVPDEMWIGYGAESWHDGEFWMDEIRWSRGIARWTENFVAPSAAYSRNTILFNQEYDTSNYVRLYYDDAIEALKFSTVVSDTEIIALSGTWTPSVGTWYHIALIRGWAGGADEWAITVDGIDIGTLSDSTAWPNIAEEFWIGACDDDDYTYLSGWIDDFRISKGKARWTAQFVVPSAAYADGSYMVIFEQRLNANNVARLYLDGCADELHFSIRASASETVALTGSWSPIVDTWYHIAVIRGWLDAANGWALTVNGSDIGTLTDADTWADLAASFDIGKCDDTDFVYFDGWIDEFRVYKGTAVWTDDFTSPSRAYDTASGKFVIGSPCRLDAIKLYVSSANTTTSTLSGEEWSGTAWTTLSNFADDTSSGGIALAQTGSLRWDTTETTSEQKLLIGYDWFWYQFSLTAGSADIYYVTVNAPFQNITNIWDRTYSFCAGAWVYEATNADYWDYADEVNEETTATVMVLDSLEATNDYILLGFNERQQGVEIAFPAGKENSTGSTVLAVYYWTGSAYSAVSSLNDGTSVGSISFASSGVISWAPPTQTEEFTKIIAGETPFYYYKLVFDQTFDSEVEIYFIEGIPVTEDILPYKFPLHFQNRTLLFNRNGAPSEVLVSHENASYIFNGPDSAILTIGSDSDLTAAATLSNSYQSSIDTVALTWKDSETWALREPGDGGPNFIQHQLSRTIGCPAPLTVDSYEIAAGLNLVIWLSYDGPYVSDGATITPIPGVEPYFDPLHSSFVGYSALENASGGIDPVLKEYNLIIGDNWLIYDIQRAKWFKKEPPSYPECIWRVQDTNGGQYCYLGYDTGYMMRNENTNAFDDSNISQSATLADMALGGLFHETQLDFLKLTVEEKSGDDDSITVEHRADGATAWTTLTAVPMFATGDPRYVQHTQRPNKQGVTHQLQLSVATDDKTKGMTPLSLDIFYRILRTDTTLD